MAQRLLTKRSICIKVIDEPFQYDANYCNTNQSLQMRSLIKFSNFHMPLRSINLKAPCYNNTRELMHKS
jgi:hypothetical protein